MQGVIRDNLSTIAIPVIILGAVMLAWPLIWSAHSDYLQGQEQQSWQKGTARDVDPRFRLIIPRIGLDAIVVEEVTEADLNRGPMHLAGTSFPGEPGNCCIAAHKEKWFRRLPELKTDDEVRMEMGGREFYYRITGKKIVRSDDTAVLADTPAATVSLITCTGPAYFGRGRGRIVLVGLLRKAE